MVTIKGDITNKKIESYLADGNDVEGFIGGFKVTDPLMLMNTELPYSTETTWSQEGTEVETSTTRTLTVDEYFSTVKNIDGVQYVYANVKTAHDGIYKLVTGEQLVMMVGMFGIENLVTKSEWEGLIEPLYTEEELNEMTVVELKSFCSDNDISGYSSLLKAEIVDLILGVV